MKSSLKNENYNMLDIRKYPINKKVNMVISNIKLNNKFSTDNIKICDKEIKIIYDFLIDSFFIKRLFYINNIFNESNFDSKVEIFKLEDIINIDDISKYHPNSYFIWHSITKREKSYYFRCSIIDSKSILRNKKLNSILE